MEIFSQKQISLVKTKRSIRIHYNNCLRLLDKRNVTNVSLENGLQAKGAVRGVDVHFWNTSDTIWKISIC